MTSDEPASLREQFERSGPAVRIAFAAAIGALMGAVAVVNLPADSFPGLRISRSFYVLVSAAGGVEVGAVLWLLRRWTEGRSRLRLLRWCLAFLPAMLTLWGFERFASDGEFSLVQASMLSVMFGVGFSRFADWVNDA